jgi:capsular polysaccharide export protein
VSERIAAAKSSAGCGEWVESKSDAVAEAGGKQRASVLYCFRFHPWKRRYVRRYVESSAFRIEFIHRPQALTGAPQGAALLIWGMRDDPELLDLAHARGLRVWRMEDGFLRSLGLGSDRTVPASLVVDRQGIYYDPRTSSELESILATSEFTEEELARARRLRETIVQLGLSKYNVGDRSRPLPKPPSGKTVVLVPGQVEDDASIRVGCVDIRTNRALLEAARVARPDAFIIYKPHPDVVSGNRAGAVSREVLERCADTVVTDAPLSSCLALADEVHTMTSLVGFEALLRGLRVTAYGMPFYAGWGLCEDRHRHPRRARTLSLDELTAGALLRYPRYMHPETMQITDAEAIVAYLKQQIGRAGNRPVRMGWLARKRMKLWNAVKGTLLR